MLLIYLISHLFEQIQYCKTFCRWKKILNFHKIFQAVNIMDYFSVAKNIANIVASVCRLPSIRNFGTSLQRCLKTNVFRLKYYTLDDNFSVSKKHFWELICISVSYKRVICSPSIILRHLFPNFATKLAFYSLCKIRVTSKKYYIFTLTDRGRKIENKTNTRFFLLPSEIEWVIFIWIFNKL